MALKVKSNILKLILNETESQCSWLGIRVIRLSLPCKTTSLAAIYFCEKGSTFLSNTQHGLTSNYPIQDNITSKSFLSLLQPKNQCEQDFGQWSLNRWCLLTKLHLKLTLFYLLRLGFSPWKWQRQMSPCLSTQVKLWGPFDCSSAEEARPP